MTTDFPMSGQKTKFMSVTNVDGAVVMPKFKLHPCKCCILF